MKRFKLSSNTSVLDVYQQLVLKDHLTVYLFVEKEPQTFEEICINLQRNGLDGFKPGQCHIAEGLVRLLQAELVEIT